VNSGNKGETIYSGLLEKTHPLWLGHNCAKARWYLLREYFNGKYPLNIALFRRDRNERWYYTLMMSTGLTFGTISAIYGLSHNIVSREQYSFLVAAVIASAVVPTLIAGFFFLPKHLLTQPESASRPTAEEMDSLQEE